MWFLKAQLQGNKRDQTSALSVTQTTLTTKRPKRERHKARVSHGTFAEPLPQKVYLIALVPGVEQTNRRNGL
jgi:hypothetical protein